MKQTTHLCLLRGLRMRGALSPIPYTCHGVVVSLAQG